MANPPSRVKLFLHQQLQQQRIAGYMELSPFAQDFTTRYLRQRRGRETFPMGVPLRFLTTEASVQLEESLASALNEQEISQVYHAPLLRWIRTFPDRRSAEFRRQERQRADELAVVATGTCQMWTTKNIAQELKIIIIDMVISVSPSKNAEEVRSDRDVWRLAADTLGHLFGIYSALDAATKPQKKDNGCPAYLRNILKDVKDGILRNVRLAPTNRCHFLHLYGEMVPPDVSYIPETRQTLTRLHLDISTLNPSAHDYADHELFRGMDKLLRLKETYPSLQSLRIALHVAQEHVTSAMLARDQRAYGATKSFFLALVAALDTIPCPTTILRIVRRFDVVDFRDDVEDNRYIIKRGREELYEGGLPPHLVKTPRGSDGADRRREMIVHDITVEGEGDWQIQPDELEEEDDDQDPMVTDS